jgi:CheY-like chemotaxis protein
MPGGGFFSIDSLHGVWIVVVDGNTVGRQMLVDILSYCGALVTPIASADGALSVMRRVKPDALIVALEDGEGSEFIRRVRSLKPEDGGVASLMTIAEHSISHCAQTATGRNLRGDEKGADARRRGVHARGVGRLRRRVERRANDADAPLSSARRR